MRNYRADMFISLKWLPVPNSLLVHLRSEEREVLRQADSWSRPEAFSKVTAIDESLTLRTAIYERLPRQVAKVRERLPLPQYDLVKDEIGSNRVACLLIRVFIHVRLRQFGYAVGLATKLLSSPEAASLPPDVDAMLQSLLAHLLISLEPHAAVEFSRCLGSRVTGSSGEHLGMFAAFAIACDALTKNLPNEALQSIHVARQPISHISGNDITGALHYLEAVSHRLLDHPAEEFNAYKCWRACLPENIANAALKAKSAGEFTRERVLLMGGERLRKLAVAQGDRAIMSALDDDFHRLGYQIVPSTESLRQGANGIIEAFQWDLFMLSTTLGRPIKKALADSISERKHRLALVSIEAPFLPIPKAFPKAMEEGELATRFKAALEKELEAAKDQSTQVSLLPHPDAKGIVWILCQRDLERVSLAIRLTDLGGSFKAQAIPVLVLPLDIPDERWMAQAEEDINSLSHRGSLWQGDLDSVIEQAARGMAPSLAPLEINLRIKKELD